MAIVGAINNVKKGKLTFEVGDEKIEFILSKFTKHPSISNFCCQVAIIYGRLNKYSSYLFLIDGLEACLIGSGIHENDEANSYENQFDKSPSDQDQCFKLFI